MTSFRCLILVLLLSLAAQPPDVKAETGEALRASRVAGARSEGTKGRKYAPDREVDILHLKLDVTPDFDSRTVEGAATLKFTPIAEPVRRLVLDAVELDIRKVDGIPAIEDVHVGAETLELTFAEALEPGEEGSVTIEYSAEPRKGLYFRTPELGYLEGDEQVWTQGETHEARYWYPAVDYPNERFSSEMICRVPEGMEARSNGRLLSVETDDMGLVTWHWLQEQSHPNYLVALVAGYLVSREAMHGELPLAFWTAPSQADLAERAFAETGEIMSFLEREIGVAYPWAKYEQAAVQDFLYGGMENTTLSILTDRILYPPDVENVRQARGLIVHELAHQWFGDYVTCKDWSHAWLNEGFATYYTWLYEREKNGEAAMRYAMWGAADTIARSKKDTRPIVQREYERAFEQFSFRAYQKGGWVLHMLRQELGDEIYRRGVRLYLERHALTSVVTDDLRRVFEEVSGRSLDRFFDQWVYHAGIPELDISYDWNGPTRQARLTVRQAQEIGEDVFIFDMPLTVRFKGEGWSREETLRLSDSEEDFYFTLDRSPESILIDPGQALLAKIIFNPGRAMLLNQLQDGDDGLARAKAARSLGKDKSARVARVLGGVLRGDSFHGARIEAAKSLGRIGTDAALEELAASLDQADARVRLEVTKGLAGAYDPISREVLLERARTETNPYILAEILRGLAAYPGDEIDALIAEKLGTDSHQQEVAIAAMEAARERDRGDLTRELLERLRGGRQGFPPLAYGLALETLGYLARDEDEHDAVLQFLIEALESPFMHIQAGALRGLRELGDPSVLATVEAFSGEDREKLVQRTARDTAEKLISGQPAEPELGRLRREVLELKSETEALSRQLETLEKQLGAGPTNDEGGASRRKFLGIF